MDTATGDDLYRIVEHYSSLGVHRAGTEIDRATAHWFATELVDRGLTVDPMPVAFERWEATSRLTVDDNEIDHLPVFHEWTGSIATDNVHFAEFDPMSGGFPGAITEPIAAARTAGADAAVLATIHPEGALVGVNRVMGEGSGFPTVLVAGREADRLRSASMRLELDAALCPGETTNVVATNGLDGPPLLLTTPLTGWFTCAGERGTGIAVLLHLIDRFLDRPVLVLATGAHELHYFGVRRWVDDNEVEPGAIVHVGASVAVDEPTHDGGRELVATRLAMTDLAAADAAPMAAALADIGLSLVTDTGQWIGESEVFCDVGAPMLSFTGSGVDFHTPGDVPERVTSPASLERAARAIAHATDALDHLVRNP